jgi:hypothetical protein
MARSSDALRRLLAATQDDPIIAIMLGDMLHELGCTVIGPAGSAAAALLIASERKDGAVLGVSRTEKQLFAR